MFTHQELLAETVNLRKFAMRLTRNVNDAEDLLQSTVLGALEKQDYFKTDTNLFGWMSKIMFALEERGFSQDSQVRMPRRRVEASYSGSTDQSDSGILHSELACVLVDDADPSEAQFKAYRGAGVGRDQPG